MDPNADRPPRRLFSGRRREIFRFKDCNNTCNMVAIQAWSWYLSEMDRLDREDGSSRYKTSELIQRR